MCDVGVMFVSQLENGKPTAQLDKAIRVANVVGLNIGSCRECRPKRGTPQPTNLHLRECFNLP